MMKKQKKTKARALCGVAVLFFLMSVLIACGGSGGSGGNDDQTGNGNWDTLVWDQDNWR
jgi:hypothetical protein